MTRPRNERDGHPRWCVGVETPGLMDPHRSTDVEVGQWRSGFLADRGRVRAMLTSTLHGPTWVTVNAYNGTGVTVDLNLEDAAKLRDGLTRLLDQAERAGTAL